MKIFLKKGTRKHIKWIFTLFLLSVIYASIGINGWKLRRQNNNAESLQKVLYSVEENKISIEVPTEQYILLQLGGLPKKQETVNICFYDKQKKLIDSHDFILLNGINSLGKYKENISFFKYSSTRVLDIEGIYHTSSAPVDIAATLKIGIGIFFLCCIQYFLIMVKRKYAS